MESTVRGRADAQLEKGGAYAREEASNLGERGQRLEVLGFERRRAGVLGTI